MGEVSRGSFESITGRFFPRRLLHAPDGDADWLSLRIVPDKQAQIYPSIFTKHKTTAREPYSEARRLCRAQLSTTTEVLVCNVRGEVMEGTLSTPYFWRDGRWVTPAAECGGNLGTTRRWALEQGLAVEGVVHRDKVREGEIVWLSNGVRGFGWARLELGRDRPV